MVGHQLLRLMVRMLRVLFWAALSVLLVICAFVFVKALLTFIPTHPDLSAVAEHTRLSFPKSAVLVESWHRELMRPETFAVVRMSRNDMEVFKENEALAGQWQEPGEDTYKGRATNTSGGALEWWNPDAAEDYIVANVSVPRDPNAPLAAA